MPTTYRVVLETETRPRRAAVALDHLPAIQVDAPNVDVAAKLAVSHHIDSRPTPPPAGTSFGLVVITPPPCDPEVPHDLDDQAEMYHLNVRSISPLPSTGPLRPPPQRMSRRTPVDATEPHAPRSRTCSRQNGPPT